ncbi:MAG: hypothetical protein JXJ17_04315 [Anaerolineae bacterium]|nr:hypothetical protein [Anaerolineae bacterium]
MEKLSHLTWDWLGGLIKRWRWSMFWRGFWLSLVIGLFLVGVPGMRPDPQSESFQALGAARDYLFDFAAWEAASLTDKAVNDAVGAQRYMSQQDQVDYVRDYLELVGQIAELERQIEDYYVDPSIADPEAATIDLRNKRDSLREDQRSRQALAESIIQSQVDEVLVDYGFGVGGKILPPLSIRFTELPTILITSPRDRIERTGSYVLQHGLVVDQQEALESEVDTELGVSSLVVPIGGLGIWPAMLIETSSVPFTYEVTAHEWTHHLLAFYPLGFNYGVTPELYTMNETTASIVGKEIGWAVLDRYYPDLAPPPPDYTPQQQPEFTPPADPDQPPAFDYRAEMHATRVRVDELLAAGKIEEAETYMEQRREVFVEQGYRIRKLNQAYFAFYGAYADEPGATGTDPVGPAVRELRYYSDSLYDFVSTIRGMTTFAELEAELSARSAR